MSFEAYKDFTNIKENNAQSEINSLVNRSLKSAKPNEDAEIFSKIVWGKDISQYGKKVDTVIENVKTLATGAREGNIQAKAEINAVVTMTLQQPLLQRLQINGVLSNTKTVGYDEELRVEYYQIQGDMSRVQATSGAFTFPTVKKRTHTVDTKTATGGIVIDYRELQSGAVDGIAMAGQQVITDITNTVVSTNISALTAAIQAATTMKNYAAGVTKTNVEAVLKKARRFGNVTILGDYSCINKLGDLASFVVTATSTDVMWSEGVMEEIRKTGLLKSYKGTPVVEIPNTYDLTTLNSGADFYNPYLPTTDLWFAPQGRLAPLATVYRGGLTSMTASDINTRSEVTRYDLEFGNHVITEFVPFMGYIYDSALAE